MIINNDHQEIKLNFKNNIFYIYKKFYKFKTIILIFASSLILDKQNENIFFNFYFIFPRFIHDFFNLILKSKITFFLFILHLIIICY